MSRIFLLGFLAVFPPFCQAILAANSSSVIDSITIQGNTRTHTHVIRRELLFVPGDRLDSNLVAETARNLRRLLYLGNPDIHVQEEHGKATILVQVQDLYSRALSPQFSGAIEELSYGLIALDYNFLGRGQTARLSLFHQAISGNSATLFYRHTPAPEFAPHPVHQPGSRHRGADIRLTFSRPLYALSARWAYGVSLFSRESIRRLYHRQSLAARYTNRLDGASFWLTHSCGRRIKYRPSIRLGLSEHCFGSTSEYICRPYWSMRMQWKKLRDLNYFSSKRRRVNCFSPACKR